MKQYIGLTWKTGYFSKLTDIDILHTNNVKIYVVLDNVKCDVKDLEMSQLRLLWDKDVNGNVETLYDSSNYINGKYGDYKFRLFVNNELIDATKYIQKYVIEFDGLYSLKVNDLVDH